MNVLEKQIGGTHYNELPYQPIELIYKLDLGFIQGNIIKYITRWRCKNGIEDLKKAEHYCELGFYYEETNSKYSSRYRYTSSHIVNEANKYVEQNSLTNTEKAIIVFVALGQYLNAKKIIAEFIEKHNNVKKA